MRKPHILQSNKTGELPARAIYFDSESRVVPAPCGLLAGSRRAGPVTLEHTPYLIIACFRDYDKKLEYWKEYDTDLKLFWLDVGAFGQSRGGRGRVHLYAHNMMYDLIATSGIPALCGQGYVVTNFFEKGNVFLLTMRKYACPARLPRGNSRGSRGDEKGGVDKTLEFISSTNYFPESLKKVGEMFGLEKLEFDHSAPLNIEEAKIYCRRDVEIVKKSVESFRDFVHGENLGVMAKTTPGQAFNAFRHRFMSHKIAIHSNPEALNLERAAYAGGRVECFRLGKYTGEFYGLDINGMYPYQMKIQKYPIELLSYQQHGTLTRLKKHLELGYLVIAKCKIITETPAVGIRYEGKYIFPVGTFWAVLSTPEIRYLLDNNQILEVSETCVYQGEYIFTDYVNYFQQKRHSAKQEKDHIREKLYKLFGNSLYGKFGQNGECWELAGSAPLEDIGIETVISPAGEITTIKVFGGSFFVQKKESESYNSFPAIASHVTAYARMSLYHYIRQAGPENVWYCDTDSLFVNAAGKQNLEEHIDDMEPGKLKIEKQGTMLEIYGLKDYNFDGDIKCKGVRKDSKQLSQTEFEHTVWPKLTTFIRAGQLSVYKNLQTVKELKRIYDKGEVLSDGTVIPFNFQELEEQARQKQERLFVAELLKEKVDIKQLHRDILRGGGIKPDADYRQTIPKHLRRKKGVGLDVMAADLAELGYHFANADELLETLTKGGLYA